MDILLSQVAKWYVLYTSPLNFVNGCIYIVCNYLCHISREFIINIKYRYILPKQFNMSRTFNETVHI